MDIEYKRISLEEKTINSLPRDTQDIIRYEDNYVLAALDGEEIITFAVVKNIPSEMMHQVCYIHYSDYDGIEYYIKKILHYIEADCMEEDEDELSVCLVGYDINMQPVFDVLVELGYTDLSDNTRLLVYRLNELKKTTFFDKTSHTELIRNNISFYNELERRQLGAFFEKCKKTGKVVNLKKSDILFTRYYLINGEIKGFLDFEETAPSVVSMLDAFIEWEPKTKYAYPVMLASALVLSDNFMPEDTIVRLYLERGYMYDALITVFGEPDIDRDIHVFGKELD